MDYKKLAEDLISGCEENCADCEYAGDIEFECTIASLAANAITALLASAEAAEAELEQKEKYYCQMFDALAATDSMELTETKKKLKAAEARAEKAEMERDEYFKHLQGLCFCCAHRKDGFDCHVKCYGHKRGSAWVYAGPMEEE